MNSFPMCMCVCVYVCVCVEAGSEREGAKMCGGARAGGIPIFIFRRSGRFHQRTTAKDPPPLAPLFAVSLLTLSCTVLNYLAKTRNNWSQSGIVVNTTAGPLRI